MSTHTKAGNSKRKMIILAIIAILVLNAVGGIIAYLTSTASVENVFTIGSVKIQLIEKGAGDVDYENTISNITIGNETVKGIGNLEGGQEIVKKPSVKNIGKNNAYVYMEVKIPTVEANGEKVELFTYTSKTGWEEIEKTARQETIDGKTYSVKVYKYTGTSEVLEPDGETGTIFDSVTVINLEDVEPEEADLKQSIIINAYAIQTSGVTIDNNQWVTQFKEAAKLKIGDKVHYTTSLNRVTLDDWSVFYVDGEYTYIILDDYLPNTAVSNTVKANYSLENGDGSYSIRSTRNRAALIAAMTTKSNWDSLLTGTMNGEPVNQTRTENVWAMGAPDVNLWANSWNATYSSDTVYTATTSSAMSDGLIGYYIGLTENPDSAYFSLTSKTGYNNKLYFPHKERIENCSGYWLASPAGNNDTSLIEISNGGYITPNQYHGLFYQYAFRPIIRLPSSVVNQ